MSNTNPFALPTLFRASGLHGGDDQWASRAMHLRVHVHPLLGLPLHPFVAFPMRDVSRDTLVIDWSTDDGTTFDPAGFDPVGHVVRGRIVGDSGGVLPPDWCWISVHAEPFHSDFRIDVLSRTGMPDGSDRVLATRRREPFEFGGSDIARLRVQGDGNVFETRGINASRLDISAFEGEPPVRFGPFAELGPWYDPGPAGEDERKMRVALGIGPEAGPPDAPRGGEPLDRDTEVARVLGQLGPEMIDPWVSAAFGDPATPPGAVLLPEERTGANGVTQTASLRATDALLTAAVDPEIARYLGLATAVDLDIAQLGPGPNIWLIGGRFIVQPGRVLNAHGTTLGDRIAARPAPSWLEPYLDGAFPDAAAIAQRIRDENAGQPPETAWNVVPMFTAAVVAFNAPPDPPEPLAWEVRGSGAWNPSAIGDGTWTQMLTLPGRPAEGPLAFARIDPSSGDPVSLHRRNPGGRAAALLAGWSSATDRIATPSGLGLRRRERTVTDGALPADLEDPSWLLWQADEWGRWSDPVKAGARRPQRPAPPPPHLEVAFEAAPREAPAGPRSPGNLRLAVRVPTAATSAPGSLPVVAVNLSSADVVEWRTDNGTIAGSSARIPVVPGLENPTIVQAVVRDVNVGAALEVEISATSEDADATPSDVAIGRRSVHDPRRPAPILTAPRVLWCSQPDPTGFSELAIRWPAADGTRFRVYLGDERRLAAELGIAVDAGELRATRARTIWLRSGELARRASFTLLTQDPVTAQGGSAVFRQPLPGTLRGVQFLRVVPLSTGGLEAAFADCPLVPVAVPADDAPPVPSLAASVEGDGGVRLVVDARGLRPDIVAARAPERPAYRIRRTRGGASDVLTMPVILEGMLEPVDGGWRADVVDDGTAAGAQGLPPFVTHTYVAEVRFPPEPDLQPGAQPVDPPQGVRPAWATVPGAAASAWSLPSTPAAMTIVPTNPPPAPEDVVFAVDAATGATVTIPQPPLPHPAAPPWTALIVREAAGGRLETLAPVELTVAPAVIADPLGTMAVGYRVALIDPLGRVGAIAVAAPAP
jgi:hypothetical protein